MRRFAPLAAALAVPLVCAWSAAASAEPASGPYLTWPGKTAPAKAAPSGRAAVALPRQFFAPGGEDLAAPPGSLAPRSVAGTQAATASDNSATNRARQNEMLTANSASDGPAGGAGNSN